jgi:hypothetical protein
VRGSQHTAVQLGAGTVPVTRHGSGCQVEEAESRLGSASTLPAAWHARTPLNTTTLAPSAHWIPRSGRGPALDTLSQCRLLSAALQ